LFFFQIFRTAVSQQTVGDMKTNMKILGRLRPHFFFDCREAIVRFDKEEDKMQFFAIADVSAPLSDDQIRLK